MTSRDDQSEAFLKSDAINDVFFTDIVANKLNIARDKFKLRLVLLSPATGNNENYVSVLYRAKIKIEITETKERKSVDVIIKALLTTIPEIKEFGVFPRERFMYENVLRSFEKIWLDRAGEEIFFGPKSFKFETDPYEIIVLDDLKAGNFEMLNRKAGLNMAQTKMLLTKLAKFHAAGAIRYQYDGIIQNYFDRKLSMPPMDPDSGFALGFMKMFRAWQEAIRKYGDCDVYADKIDKWDSSKLFTQFIDVAEPMRCGFQILNHGDAWLNNMMFKSDADNNPLEVCLIDFQINFWAGPGVDLWYFLSTSVADDIKVDHFDNFIKFYHEQLIDGLKKLNYDQYVPSLAEIYDDIQDKSGFGTSCLMFILFVVKYESNEEINMEMLMAGGDEAMFDRAYNNETYKKAIKLWLPFLEKRGYLNSLIKVEENGDEKSAN